MIAAARSITGCDIKVEIAPRRAGDPAILIASSDKIKRELGWQPRYNSLNDIIATAWAWHRSHPDGYAPE